MGDDMKRDTLESCIHRLIENARAILTAKPGQDYSFCMGRYTGAVEMIEQIRRDVPANVGRPVMENHPQVWALIMQGRAFNHHDVLTADHYDRLG
jgi:hypothetical protein